MGSAKDKENGDVRAAIFTLAQLARILDRASGDLGLGQYRVLAMLAGGDEMASRVAERLALGKPAVSSAITALEARGLVKKSAVKGDRRATQLDVTAKGRARLEQAEVAMAAKLAELLDICGEPTALSGMKILGVAIDQQRSRRSARHAHTSMAGKARAT